MQTANYDYTTLDAVSDPAYVLGRELVEAMEATEASLRDGDRWEASIHAQRAVSARRMLANTPAQSAAGRMALTEEARRVWVDLITHPSIADAVVAAGLVELSMLLSSFMESLAAEFDDTDEDDSDEIEA